MRLVCVLILIYFSYIRLGGLSTVKWNVTKGETIPTLKTRSEGEILTISLREAPFCRLSATHKCQCFMARRIGESSEWILASFKHCNGSIRGRFSNDSGFFEIDTIVDGMSIEYPTIDDIFMGQNMDTIYNMNRSFHYFEPISESGLKYYETGFIPCLFVIDEELFKYVSKDRIDFFLQDMISEANEYFHEFNLVTVYKGWKQAEVEDTELKNTTDTDRFILHRYRHYIERNTQNLVILFSPKRVSREPNESDKYDYVGGRALQHSICNSSIGMWMRYQIDDGQFYNVTQVITLVHEIGHALGLLHTQDTRCNGTLKGNIDIMNMNIAVMKIIEQLKPGYKPIWSNCSREVIWERRPTFFCLRERIKPLKPSCRNGVLEEGEQCECVSEVCRKCCDDKCQLTNNSECSSGPCCDEITCKLRTENDKYTCRKAKDLCDIPERCNGTSVECPPNYVVANGYECSDSSKRAYCFNGMCGSRQDTCSWIYLNGTIGEDKCYENNMKDDIEFGCGPVFMEENEAPKKVCKKEDISCGKIFCSYSENRTMNYTLDSCLYIEMDRIKEKRVEESPCVYLKLGNYTRNLREDPTFVQNGSECGEEKMCVKQKCRPLPPGCPKECPGDKIEHPDTNEMLPAFILPESGFSPVYEPDEPKKPSSSNWIYFLLPGLALILSIAMLFLHRKQSEAQKAQTSPTKTVENSPSQDHGQP